MKNYKFYVGIDISKASLDFCLIDLDATIVYQGKTENNSKGVKRILNVVKKHKIPQGDVLFSFENTGIYSLPLNIYFSEEQVFFSEIPALEIKHSKGITRGKNDKIDARDIALYSLRNFDKIVLSLPPDLDILELKLLFAEREKVVQAIKLFNSTKENENFILKIF